MKITLQTVREVLRETFGRDSFIASFIRSIQESKECPTACINAEGVLKYYPEFVDDHIQSPEDLFCILVHEMLHPMFGHFVYQGGEIENIAADMVINATISQMFKAESGHGSLFQRFYKPNGIEGLLRPDSAMNDSRYSALYLSFYFPMFHRRKLSTGEVIQTLKVLTPSRDAQSVVLLGDHQQGGQGKAQPLSGQIRARIAEDLKKVVDNHPGQQAGWNPALSELFIEILNTQLSFKKALLERFETQRKVDRFQKAIHATRMSTSPVPIHPSKRELVMIGAGIIPFHYKYSVHHSLTENHGLAVYLDVSGSVHKHLPEIIGLLRTFQKQLLTVFLFSNKVVEVPFRKLLKGEIQTTGGTDFNCIAESILELNLDKAVVITDGYASMNPALRSQLDTQHVQALVVLFGDMRKCSEFGTTSEVVRLEDVTSRSGAA